MAMVNITAVPTAAEVISNLSVPWKGDDSLEEYHRFLYERLPLLQGRQRSLAELIEENPAYRQVAVDWYEESEHPEVVQGHSYYYVPSMFIGTEKLYEAQPGQSYDDIKAHVKAALDAALKA